MFDDARAVVEAFGSLLAQTEDPAARSRLIKRAELLGAKEVPKDAFEPPVTPLGEYLDTPIEVPPSLVWPTIVVRGELTATLGRAGKGKTTMNLNRIFKWAAGRPLFDGFVNPEDETQTYLAPERPLRTLILENEGSAGMFHQKVGTMVYNCGDVLSDEDRELIRENIFIWGDGGYSGLKLDNDQNVAHLRAGIEKCEPDIVFVEPFRGLWKGEENSSTDMAVVIDNIIAMATDYKCGFVLSHHERKGGAGDDDLMSAGRGSTVLEGAVACMENFQGVKGQDLRQMQWSKARYLQPPPTMRLEYSFDTGWYSHVPDSRLEIAVLEAINEADSPVTKADLAEMLSEKPEDVSKVANKLATEGRIKRLQSESVPGGRGTTGYRYASLGDTDDNPLNF